MVEDGKFKITLLISLCGVWKFSRPVFVGRKSQGFEQLDEEIREKLWAWNEGDEEYAGKDGGENGGDEGKDGGENGGDEGWSEGRDKGCEGSSGRNEVSFVRNFCKSELDCCKLFILGGQGLSRRKRMTRKYF